MVELERQKITATNIGLAIWRLTCFYETFVQGSTAVILLNFCAKNPPHRQAFFVMGKLKSGYRYTIKPPKNNLDST